MLFSPLSSLAMATSTFDPESKIWSVEKGPHDKSFPNDLDLGTAILQQLDTYLPEKILEIHCESETKLTVAEIKRRSLSCAQNLLKMGIKQGDVVVIYSQVNKDVAPVILGTLLIGAIFNTFETTFNEDDVKASLNNLSPKAILYDERFHNTIKNCFDVENLKVFLAFGDLPGSIYEKLLSEQEPRRPDKLRNAANELPACMLFTSGSTGCPKSVIISHSLLARGMMNLCKVYPNDIMFAPSPLRWISHILVLLQTIYYGATRVISYAAPDKELFCGYIKKYKVNKVFGAVGLISNMISVAKETNPGCLDSLNYILLGGEVVSVKVRQELTTLLKDVDAVSVYGMSEFAGAVAGNEFCQDKSINGGQLKYGFKFKVIDEDHNPLDPNEKGVLCVKYDDGFLGYQNNDKANKEAFLADGWFYTGDFVKISSGGIIQIFGRAKDNICCDGLLVRDID